MTASTYPKTRGTIPFLIGSRRVGCAHHPSASRFREIVAVALFLTIVSTAQAKYSGGSGTAQDPYQIATAADLIALGETPEDYDKHFLLTADIDLDPNLPGRKVFDKAVIAPAKTSRFEATPFTGFFDGNGHTISHLTIKGKDSLGLFGGLGPGAEVKDLGVVDIDIIGSGDNVGGLVGSNSGSVTNCYSTGPLSGTDQIGGLVGYNDYGGSITNSWSVGTVIGNFCVGGLVGFNEASIRTSYSVGEVRGTWQVGGLVGWSHNLVTGCCSTGAVRGDSSVGGLVGRNGDSYHLVEVTRCYSTGAVTGNSLVGGLVGCRSLGVTACIWDTQTSGQATSAGGTGKTTAEMQTASTFLKAGWDFVGETANGNEDIWKIAEGLNYPRLSWEKYSGGSGEPNDPYQIATAADLILLGETPADYDKHFILTADIDLDPNLPGRKVFDKAVIAPDTFPNKYSEFQGTAFTGVFDGNRHAIAHLNVTGKAYVGVVPHDIGKTFLRK